MSVAWIEPKRRMVQWIGRLVWTEQVDLDARSGGKASEGGKWRQAGGGVKGWRGGGVEGGVASGGSPCLQGEDI